MSLIRIEDSVGVMFVFVMAFYGLDFVTGLYKAIKLKEVSSKKMKHGLFNFCAIIVVMIVAEMGGIFVDLFGVVPHPQLWVCGSVSAYFIIMEAISICENLYDAGFEHIPPMIVKYLKSRDTGEIGDDVIKAAAKVIAQKELDNDDTTK